MLITSLAFLAFITLMIVLRLPIGIAIGTVGFVGTALLRGWGPATSMAASEVLEVATYSLSVMPLFVLKANFVTRGGLSRDLYQAAYAFMGHRKGGLATSTIAASAGFGAMCGSSIATAATMSRVALPQMRRLGYKDSLASASVAAGGTLGILIPPSTILVIYGLMTETSIGALFAAGIFPVMIAILFYMGAVAWTIWRDPEAGPRGEKSSWRTRWAALREVWAVLLLFTVVMVGLYTGYFTATEGAGVGAAGGFAIAWWRKALTLRILREILIDSAKTSAMLFTILVGAQIFTGFVNFTSLPEDLKQFVLGLGLSPKGVVVAICAIYILLGCIMEAMSMIFLTVPIFFPLIVALGFDPIWFGILLVCVIEIGLIHPPLGMNVFVIRASVPDVDGNQIWKGLLPFITADLIRIAVLITFPALSLYLPHLFKL